LFGQVPLSGNSIELPLSDVSETNEVVGPQARDVDSYMSPSFRFNLFDPFGLGERFAFAEACREENPL
jgi:hypothetical protein